MTDATVWWLPRTATCGTTILNSVTGQDYPLISASTLIITIMVLVAMFVIELVYGIIDPRIKAAQAD